MRFLLTWLALLGGAAALRVDVCPDVAIVVGGYKLRGETPAEFSGGGVTVTAEDVGWGGAGSGVGGVRLVVSPRGGGNTTEVIVIPAATCDPAWPFDIEADDAIEVAVWPAAEGENECAMLTGGAFCDSATNDLRREIEEPGFADLLVSIEAHNPTVRDYLGAQVVQTRTDAYGGFRLPPMYVPPDDTVLSVTTTYRTLDNVEEVSTKVPIRGRGVDDDGCGLSQFCLRPQPYNHYLSCPVPNFASLPIAAADCRCGTIRIDVDIDSRDIPEGYPPADTVVIRREITIQLGDDSTLNATALPPLRPLFYEVGAGAALNIFGANIVVNSHAFVLSGGGRSVVSSSYIRSESTPVAYVTPASRIDNNIFSLPAVDGEVLFVAPDPYMNGMREFRADIVETDACGGTQPHFVGGPASEDVAIVGLVEVCGPDATLRHPCIGGDFDVVTRKCVCHRGCRGEFCGEYAKPARGNDFLCFETSNNTYAAMELTDSAIIDILDAALIQYGAPDEKPGHFVRDDGSMPNWVYSKFPPPSEPKCNCATAPTYDVSTGITATEGIIESNHDLTRRRRQRSDDRAESAVVGANVAIAYFAAITFIVAIFVVKNLVLL